MNIKKEKATLAERCVYATHPLGEEVAMYHQLVESGTYARCTCRVEFYWADRAIQFERHRAERIISALSVALGEQL
jgi:hypothetical protein